MEYSLLGRLPLELRYMIYEFVSTDSGLIKVSINRIRLSTSQSSVYTLSQVCRTIRSEILGRRLPDKALDIYIRAATPVCWERGAENLARWAQRLETNQMLSKVTSIIVKVEVPEFDIPKSYVGGLLINESRPYSYYQYTDEASRFYWKRLMSGIQSLCPEKQVDLTVRFHHYKTGSTVENSFPLCRPGASLVLDECPPEVEEVDRYKGMMRAKFTRNLSNVGRCMVMLEFPERYSTKGNEGDTLEPTPSPVRLVNICRASKLTGELFRSHI